MHYLAGLLPCQNSKKAGKLSLNLNRNFLFALPTSEVVLVARAAPYGIDRVPLFPLHPAIRAFVIAAAPRLIPDEAIIRISGKHQFGLYRGLTGLKLLKLPAQCSLTSFEAFLQMDCDIDQSAFGTHANLASTARCTVI
jgi:hypothetical protein